VKRFDLDQILGLAQDVVDRCLPVVPSRPLAKLSSESQWFTALEHDSAEVEELSLVVDEINNSWSWWPEEAFGSTRCEGPSVADLERLQAAIDAVKAMDEESSA